jgi:uncharacterized protein
VLEGARIKSYALASSFGEILSHTIIHFEIPADDVVKLKGFYSDVFNWTFISNPEMDYYVFHTVPTDEKGMLKVPGVNGGLYKRTQPKQIPINYIRVESIDEYVDKVVKNGGKVISPKTEVPKVGSIVWVTDPEGNPFGMLQPSV